MALALQAGQANDELVRDSDNKVRATYELHSSNGYSWNLPRYLSWAIALLRDRSCSSLSGDVSLVSNKKIEPPGEDCCDVLMALEPERRHKLERCLTRNVSIEAKDGFSRELD